MCASHPEYMRTRVRATEMFTAGGDVGEALALAPFPLAVADIEVDVDRGGQSLVAIGRDLNHEAVLQQRKATRFNLTKVSDSCPTERQKENLFHLWIFFLQ